ncbi:MAG: ComEA family DNA-binding protein, partial [Microthrixaceae bacterium]
MTAAVVAVAVLASLVLARRPPPIDERLPMTAAGDASTEAPSNERTDGDPVVDPDAGTASSAASDQGAGDPPGDGAASGEVVVHVAGAVTAPGVVRLAATGRIVDAVAA